MEYANPKIGALLNQARDQLLRDHTRRFELEAGCERAMKYAKSLFNEKNYLFASLFYCIPIFFSEKYQDRGCLEIARCYEETGKLDLARYSYEFIITNSTTPVLKKIAEKQLSKLLRNEVHTSPGPR